MSATLTPADDDAVKSETFSTHLLRLQDQHEAWREWFRPVLDVLPQHPADGGFLAENQIWKLSGLTVSRVCAPAVRVVRRRANLRRDPVDHWVLTYCRSGATIIRTDTASLEAPAGVPFLWSLGEETESERTQVERVQFFLTRDAFREIAPLLDAARATALDSPLGRLLGDYMLAVERRLPSLTPADLPGLMKTVHAMVAAAVAPSADRLAGARSQIDLGRVERVRKAVRENLRATDLGPVALCRLVGMSRSNLYRLFEELGGVARYIQVQRLAEAHATLCDTNDLRPIFAIAEEFRFPDASSFSRAFRREFGYSPTETRAAAMVGQPPPAERQNGTTSGASDFGGLLRGF